MSNEEFCYHQSSLADCDTCNNQPSPNSLYSKDFRMARFPSTDSLNRYIKAYNTNPAFSQISPFPWYSFGCLSEENTQSSSQDFSNTPSFFQPNSTSISESSKQSAQEPHSSSTLLQTGDNAASSFGTYEDAGDESMAASLSLLQKHPISRDSQCQCNYSTNFNDIHETHIIEHAVDDTTTRCSSSSSGGGNQPTNTENTFSDPSSNGEESETLLSNRAKFLCLLESERNCDLWNVNREQQQEEEEEAAASEISTENDSSALTIDKSHTAPNFRAWLNGATKSSNCEATTHCSTTAATSGSSRLLNGQDRVSKYSEDFSALQEHTTGGNAALCTTNRNTTQETCDSSSFQLQLPLTTAATSGPTQTTTIGANKSLRHATNKAPLRVAIATEEEELEEVAAQHSEQQQQHRLVVDSFSSQSEQLDNKSSEAVKCQDPTAFSRSSTKTHFNHNSRTKSAGGITSSSNSSSVPKDLRHISNILSTSCSRGQETMMTMRKSSSDAKRKPLQAIENNFIENNQWSNTDQLKNNVVTMKNNEENDNSMSSILNPNKTKENPKNAFSIYDPNSAVKNIDENQDQSPTISDPQQEKTSSAKTFAISSTPVKLSSNFLYDNKAYHLSNFLTMYHRQFEFMPTEFFMYRQKDINCSMRYKLVDWIIEVVDELGLKRQTLFVCTNIIDRFLSKLKIQRSKLQLLGATALLIASKFEEIHPHPVKMFAHLTDNSYTEAEILKMERIVLRTIKFDLCIPSLENFAEFAFRSMESNDSHLKSYVNYIEELILVDFNTFSSHPCSHLALAAVVLSLHCLGEYPWPDELEVLAQTIDISFNDLLPSIFDIYRMLGVAKNSKNTIFVKYSSPAKQSVGNIILPQTLPILIPVNNQASSKTAITAQKRC